MSENCMTHEVIGDAATLKIYSAVSGYREEPVRKFSVGEVKPYAQYDRSVTIRFTEPRKRNGKLMTVHPDDVTIVIIEANGSTVYDSRIDIPVDMDKWHATNGEWKGNRPFRMRSYRADGTLRYDSADDPDPDPPAIALVHNGLGTAR